MNQSWPWRQAVLSVLPGSVFMAYFVLRARSPIDGRFTLFDDAMVSMAYGRTLAGTGEWVWFPGADRVQGFTNPLWTLYMALLHFMGLEGSSAAFAISITSAIAIIATSVVIFELLWKCLPIGPLKLWTPSISAATIPFLYPLVFWGLRGMEVGVLALFSALLLRSSFQLLSSWRDGHSVRTHYLGFVLIAMLGLLTRLDFLVVVATLFLLLFAWAPSKQIRIDIIYSLLLPVIGIVLLILAFQYFYFGDRLSNTYYLKMEGFSLSDRLRRGLHASAKSMPVTILTGAALALFMYKHRGSIASQIGVFLSIIWFASLAYSIWVGGDAWEWGRFDNRYLAMALPSAATAVLLALSQLISTDNRKSWWAVPVVALTLFSGIGFSVGTNPFSADFDIGLVATGAMLVPAAVLIALLWLGCRGVPSSSILQVLTIGACALFILASSSFIGVRDWMRSGGLHVIDDALMTEVALQLREASAPGTSFATVWAGSPGYYLDRPVIDLLGKNDHVIARSTPASWPFYPGHNKWDYDYSIGELRPDFILDLWSATPQDQDNMREWGYTPFCWPQVPFRSYGLRSGANIALAQLTPCPPEQ